MTTTPTTLGWRALAADGLEPHDLRRALRKACDTIDSLEELLREAVACTEFDHAGLDYVVVQVDRSTLGEIATYFDKGVDALRAEQRQAEVDAKANLDRFLRDLDKRMAQVQQR